MIKINKNYTIWLIGVVIWNFGLPYANPVEDVIMAVLLGWVLAHLDRRSQ